jgi:hypothetical protein
MEDKRAPNQQYGVPLAIYQERYQALDPAEVTRRTCVPFDTARGVFELTVLGFALDAAWPEFSLCPADPEACPRDLYGSGAKILMIRYLLEGALAAPCGTFLPYRELPWGSVYDQNFQGRCIKRLAFAFGSKLDLFAKSCEALGGTPHPKADASYDLPFLPALTVRLLLWSGDDEFPPQSQWLFSDNTPLAFSAEDVAVIGDVTIGALKEMGKRA